MKAGRRLEYLELVGLFFLLWMAAGIWMVSLSPVLDAHGLHAIRPYAFAASGIAAFVSPLIFGAMADRHAAPVKVLRGLTIAASAATFLATWSIERGWPPGVVLLFILILALCASPIFSIATAVVFARLQNPKSEFGPIRAAATFGWMCGCWLVSALNADASTHAGYIGVVMWLVLTAFTFLLPAVPPPESAAGTTWHERLGWDALVLLKNRDTRVVFITAALYNIPLAAFYPLTPPHLKQLGFQHTAAWMTLGQVTEIIAMLALAALFLRVRLKWIFAAGLGFGVVRYVFCAFNSPVWLLVGITLHGFSYSLYYIPAQIYLDERIDPAWRARAQALLSLMVGGVGNLFGFLGTGWWFNSCTESGATRWPIFWLALAASSGVVMVYFLAAYHGRPQQRRPDAD